VEGSIVETSVDVGCVALLGRIVVTSVIAEVVADRGSFVAACVGGVAVCDELVVASIVAACVVLDVAAGVVTSVVFGWDVVV